MPVLLMRNFSKEVIYDIARLPLLWEDMPQSGCRGSQVITLSTRQLFVYSSAPNPPPLAEKDALEAVILYTPIIQVTKRDTRNLGFCRSWRRCQRNQLWTAMKTMHTMQASSIQFYSDLYTYSGNYIGVNSKQSEQRQKMRSPAVLVSATSRH